MEMRASLKTVFVSLPSLPEGEKEVFYTVKQQSSGSVQDLLEAFSTQVSCIKLSVFSAFCHNLIYSGSGQMCQAKVAEAELRLVSF